jgi:integrase
LDNLDNLDGIGQTDSQRIATPGLTPARPGATRGEDMAGKDKHRGWGHVRKRPGGKYQASYIGPDLVRHCAPKTFTAKMDAEHWLSDERRMIERGDWTSPRKRVENVVAQHITLAEYGQTWINQRNVKPRTRIGYQALFDNHITPVLGKVALVHLTPESIRAWHAGLGSEHSRRNSHAYGLLHAILGTAVTDQLIPANPATISRAMNVAPKRQAVILDVHEVEALADAIRPERMRALILVLAWTGLRWGEAIELQRRDVTEGAKAIRVSRAVTHREGCHVDTPKSGRGRTVIVPPHIREDLRHHLDTYVGSDASAQLFPAKHGCHLNDRTFRDYLAPALKSIGRQGMRIHDLRHFAGTQAARAGGTLPEVMERLGHSTAKAAMAYQQVANGRSEAVAEALSKLAKPTT